MEKLIILLAISLVSLVFLGFPAMIFIKAIISHKKYSVIGFINIFLVSSLAAIPVIHFYLLSEVTMGRGGLSPIEFFNGFLISAPLSIFVGLIGIAFNSIYIFVLRVLKKS